MVKVKVTKSSPFGVDDDDDDWIPLIPESREEHNGNGVISGGDDTNHHASSRQASTSAVIISDTSSTCSSETIPHANGFVKTRPRTPKKKLNKGGKFLQKSSTSSNGSSSFCCGRSKKATLIMSLIISYMICVLVVAISLTGNNELLMNVFGNHAIGQYCQQLLGHLGIVPAARQGAKKTSMTENEKIQLKQQQRKAARGIRYPTNELNLPPTDSLPRDDPLKEQAWKETIQNADSTTTAYLAEEGSAEKQTYREQARLAEEEAKKAVEAEKLRIAKALREEDAKIRKEREEQHKRWKSDWKSIRKDVPPPPSSIVVDDSEDAEKLKKKREAAIVATKAENIENQINNELKDGDIQKKAFAAQVIAEQERHNAQNHMSTSTKEEREAAEARRLQLQKERIEKETELERQRRKEHHKRWKSDWKSTRQDEDTMEEEDLGKINIESLSLQEEHLKVLGDAKHAAEVAQALVDAEKRRREQENKEEEEESLDELHTTIDEEQQARDDDIDSATRDQAEAEDEEVVEISEASTSVGQQMEEVDDSGEAEDHEAKNGEEPVVDVERNAVEEQEITMEEEAVEDLEAKSGEESAIQDEEQEEAPVEDETISTGGDQQEEVMDEVERSVTSKDEEHVKLDGDEDETNPRGGDQQDEEINEDDDHAESGRDEPLIMKSSSALLENQSDERVSTRRRGFRFWRRINVAEDPPDRPKRRFRWFGNRRNSKVNANRTGRNSGTTGEPSGTKVIIVPRGVVGLWKRIRSVDSAVS